jgi:hypothetical protein
MLIIFQRHPSNPCFKYLSHVTDWLVARTTNSDKYRIVSYYTDDYLDRGR